MFRDIPVGILQNIWVFSNPSLQHEHQPREAHSSSQTPHRNLQLPEMEQSVWFVAGTGSKAALTSADGPEELAVDAMVPKGVPNREPGLGYPRCI